MADVLDTGPPRRPVRTRRWVTTAGAVVVAGVAAVLAGNATGDRTTAPASATTAPARADHEPVLVSVAAGRGSVYALAAECDTGTAPACGYQLYRRDGSRGWQPVPWQVAPRSGVGPAPVVSVTSVPGVPAGPQREVVTVLTSVDPPQVRTSTDGGRTVTAHPLTTGPPVAAVPRTGLLTPGVCATCDDEVTTLDPTTGAVRTLAVPPPLGGAHLRSYDRSGDVVWAVGVDRRTTVSAVSTDAGRSWRRVPVPGASSPNQLLRVLAGADGSAWLVAGSYLGGPPQQLNRVRRIDGPGGRWRELPDRDGPRTMRSVLAGGRGLLVVEVNGTVWRLPPAGPYRQLPDPGPFRPGDLVRGSPGPVVSLSPDDADNRTVLLSDDEGESWRAERVP